MKKILSILLIIFVFALTGCTESDFNISLGYKNLSMNVGETLVLSTNFADIKVEEETTVTWNSSDINVATVNNNGVISAVSEGYTYITATYGDYSSKIYLSVTSSWVDQRQITITGTQMVVINQTTKLTANIELKENEYIIWESLDEKIATIDQNGNVKGILTGLVTIRATLSSNNSIYKEATVLVRKGTGIQEVIYNYIYSDSYKVTGDIDLTDLSNKSTEIIEKAAPAVIGISNYILKSGIYVLNSIGSAVIYKRETLSNTYKYTALTNYHVVSNSTSYEYKLMAYIGNDEDIEVAATVTKIDSVVDLAIVTFEYTKEITPITFASENSVVNGDFVFAIGNPTGYTYYNTATFGIASYINRVLSENNATYIQHDAAINSGNSGGALINLNGELIGINTLKIAKLTVEGMGFAIDIKTINSFLN